MRNHDEVIGGGVSTIYGGIHTNSALNFDYVKIKDGRVSLERYKFEPIANDSRIIPKNVVYPQPVFCHISDNHRRLPNNSLDRALASLHDGKSGDRLEEVIQGLKKHGISSAEEIANGISTTDGRTLHDMVAHAMANGKIDRREAREINKAIRSFA